MKQILIKMTACLIFVLFLFSLVSCGNLTVSISGDTTDSSLSTEDTKPSGDVTAGEAELVFTESSDGYILTGIKNPSGFDNLSVVVPDMYNGRPVVGIDIDKSVDFIIPRMLTVKAFESIMDAFAEVINRDSAENGYGQIDWRATDALTDRSSRCTSSGNSKWFEFAQFEAYFAKKQMSSTATERERILLINEYPQCKTEDIYVLSSDIQHNELVNLVSLLQKYVPSYSYHDKLRDETEAHYYRWMAYWGRIAATSRILSREETDRIWESIEPRTPLVARDSITSFMIRGNVKYITGCPLACTRVTNFVIPEGVTEISSSFFYGCKEDIDVTYGGKYGWVAKYGALIKPYTVSDLLKRDVVASFLYGTVLQLEQAPN